MTENKSTAEMLDSAIEQEIRSKGLTAPRVTPEDIEANIASVFYFTADQGAIATMDHYPLKGELPAALDLLTFCVLVLKNGFTVTGESACASPENFDAELGRKIARQNAISKVWPLMGYALKERIASTNRAEAFFAELNKEDIESIRKEGLSAVIDRPPADAVEQTISQKLDEALAASLSWQQRVIAEKAELDEKLKKLEAFLGGDQRLSLSVEAAGHLYEQATAMRLYSLVLEADCGVWIMSTSQTSTSRDPLLFGSVQIIESIPVVRESIAHCLAGCRFAYAVRNSPLLEAKSPIHLAAERVGKWLATGRA